MRRKLIAGNWKMNGSRAALAELVAIDAEAKRANGGVEVAIALPATLIEHAAALALDVAIGAQDVHAAQGGAHTGCLCAAMLAEAGATFTLVGHSERRADQHETDQDVRGKAQAARGAGLSAILCVGETAAERDAGLAAQIVRAQIEQSMPDGAAASWLTIAYEPRWAIGTGRTPMAADIADVHALARATLRDLLGEGAAQAMRILYGGSVTGENAAQILAIANVDGALVGGASLTAEKFVPIITAGASLA